MSPGNSLSSGEVVQAGYDAMTIKCLSTAVGTVLLYDYLLTFLDEVRYLWARERKQWTFYLFLFNRYFPILYVVWSRVVLGDFRECESTVKVHGVCFLLFLLSGQVVMITRLQSISVHRHVVIFVFGSIILAQLAIGLVGVFYSHSAAASGASINFPVLQLCFFTVRARMGYAYTGLSLLFDVTIFLWISAAILGFTGSLRVPSNPLLTQIMREASVYFLVMVCSHLVIAVFQIFGPDTLRVAPTLAVTIISPVMVSRMVLSLARSMSLNQILLWDFHHGFALNSIDSDLSLSTEVIRRYLKPSQGEPWEEEEPQCGHGSLM